jgi:chromate reductase
LTIGLYFCLPRKWWRAGGGGPYDPGTSLDHIGDAVKILAISGSLRAGSSNTGLLHAMAALAPEGVEVAVYGGLADLPHFNPDLDPDGIPAVADFRARLAAADGVLISSPEYAHGVAGVMKNALDWVVASGEFVDKPVALINASPRAHHAQEALTETLVVMTARMVPEASIAVPLLGQHVELQRADHADQRRRAVARRNTCTTPSSDICCSASFSFLAFIASVEPDAAHDFRREARHADEGRCPRPRSACRRSAACRGWECRRRRRQRPRRPASDPGRRRIAAPTATSFLPVRTSLAFMPRVSLPEHSRA